jgi:hypothetical protein
MVVRTRDGAFSARVTEISLDLGMPPTNHRFVVYDLSLEMARKRHAVVVALRRNDAELADQLHRASVSVVRNVAKGRGR